MAHRRAGKTVALLNEALRAALRCDYPDPRVAYIAPGLKQCNIDALVALANLAGLFARSVKA